MEILRQKRIADFRKRASFDAGSVYECSEIPCRYIPINPFSDEIDLLRGLKIRPSSCLKVDAWCELNGDATLLESVTKKYGGPVRNAGCYARKTSHELEWTYLLYVTDNEFINRKEFECALQQFSTHGFPDENDFSALSNVYTRVGENSA